MSSFSLVSSDPAFASKPFIDGDRVLLNGKIFPWTGDVEDVTSPILDSATGKRLVIGRMARMDAESSVQAFESAKAAWKEGAGEWPQMPANQRISAVLNLVTALKKKRDEIVTVLQWEICKTRGDAEAEFDRTMVFIHASIEALTEMDEREGNYVNTGGVFGRFRRAAIGVMLALGPFNYPFNETYTTIIPALLMGNTIVMKIPTTGGLAHVLTMEAYASCFPPGVVNFISGAGRLTMGPVMRLGPDIFAFIGGSSTADVLLKEHPAPHRLRIFLSLEGKNPGIVTASSDVDTAVEQCLLGATTYNGQRCTAIKIIFVHESLANEFVSKFSARVTSLKLGLPWEEGVLITPLPEPDRPAFLANLIQDALSKGAHVMNEEGGKLYGNLMRPAVLYPVSKEMRLWSEEQFGPVVPIASFQDISEIKAYISDMPFGQQAAIFSNSVEEASSLIDFLSTAVGRINLNTQCSRSPDILPFSGRRSSANGTLSVSEALKAFSIETVVAGKSNEVNEHLLRQSESASNFLMPLSKL